MLLFLAGVLLGWAHSPIFSTFQQMEANISTQFFQSCSCFFFLGSLESLIPVNLSVSHKFLHMINADLGAPF